MDKFSNKTDYSNVSDSRMYDYINKPIGLVANSYDFVIDTLRRNIGNTEFSYDGFGTPIGELSNPFYNSDSRTPWFFVDADKNRTSNYIDYVKSTYGASLSVMNINEVDTLKIIGRASSVGVVQTYSLMDAILGDAPAYISLINPNGYATDTKLGADSTLYGGKTLISSVAGNDLRKARNYNGGITKDLKDYFGLNTVAVVENDVLGISGHNKGKSYLSKGYYNSQEESPIENTNYGHYSDLGAYEGFYDALSDESKSFFESNVYSKDKKYYPKEGKSYLSILKNAGVDELQIRYVFGTLDEHSNVANVNNTVYVYTELEGNSYPNIQSNPFNTGTKFGIYTSYGDNLKADDLLYKTNLAFKKGNYDTLIARFHTPSNKADLTDTTQTAISKEYGLSHGRNLLKLEPDESQGYENPYCRVWTYHHQYHKLADAIRPFQSKGEKGNVVIGQKELYDNYGFKEFSADHSLKGFEDGRTRLEKYGTINKHNGLVNITPIDSGDPNKKVDIKNCMFSIENLAWKGAFSSYNDEKKTFQNGGLSSEQKGPFGGRIMWFPPYDLKFNETVSVSWDDNNFIGRGESIYTYKNTRRSGQLSFKLLIDHPSIINYWENRGKSISDSVDDKNDPEQQLLRFFAGCEMLSSKKAETKKNTEVVKNEAVPYPNTKRYTFFVFFPNDYSGFQDDTYSYPMEYITNGVGTWKLKSGNNYYPSYSSCMVGNTLYGGYEMRPGKGISVVSEQTVDNKIATVKYGNQSETEIYAQFGDSGENAWDYKYYYKVDKDRTNEKYKHKESYIDKNSNCLNSNLGKDKVKEFFNLDESITLVSLADVFVALTDDFKKSSKVLEGLYNEENVNILKDLFKNKKDKIKLITCTGQASIQGNSSSETTNKKRNDSLAKRRAETTQMWLKSLLNDVKFEKVKVLSPEGDKIVDDTNDIVNKIHRCCRVDIYVATEESITTQNAVKDAYRDGSEVHPTNPSYPSGNGTGEPLFVDDAANVNYDPKTLKMKQDFIKMSAFGHSVDYLTMNLKESVHNGNINLNGVFNAVEGFREINKAANDYALDFSGNISGKFTEVGGSKEGNLAQYDMDNSSVLNKEKVITQETETIKRYDNESKFFEMLEIEEPFLHKKISDKVKYFDPAFHSVSPEGFNARLTFLHQCTRQGPTCGNSDIKDEHRTANNLSFGRPPVCILRIGDFYYTRIIIESIHIDYASGNGISWDLNAEGIGVMPMIADVNITFNYIGGSSLSGPISRLQNALSFNMYANTEVYDNRSELVEYDGNGNISKFGPSTLKN